MLLERFKLHDLHVLHVFRCSCYVFGCSAARLIAHEERRDSIQRHTDEHCTVTAQVLDHTGVGNRWRAILPLWVTEHLRRGAAVL
jgi:hypothetical protein